MVKAILISINPKWVKKILNGEKTIEIRKIMPKCDLPIDVYIYCTKQDSLMKLSNFRKDKYICGKEYDITDFVWLNSDYEGKGKVVAKFTLNKVEEIEYVSSMACFDLYYGKKGMKEEKILSKSCLSFDELYDYLRHKNGYAWHIDNLVIFDKPKELGEFHKSSWAEVRYKTMREEKAKQYRLTRAPQSWCFVEL